MLGNSSREPGMGLADLTVRAAMVVHPSLSPIEAKRLTYACEIYFRECWADMVRYADESTVVQTVLHATLLLIKPDGIAARAIDPVLQALDQHGFEVLAGIPVLLDRLSMRELWRYEMNL